MKGDEVRSTSHRREQDHDSMLKHIDLWSYDDVRKHRGAILGRLG